jgi:hypothetical protein
MAEAVGVKSMRRAVLALVAAVVIAISGVGAALYLRSEAVQNNATETCEAINDVKTTLRGILLRSEDISLKHFQPGLGFTEAQIRAYYEHSLRDLAPANCIP